MSAAGAECAQLGILHNQQPAISRSNVMSHVQIPEPEV